MLWYDRSVRRVVVVTASVLAVCVFAACGGDHAKSDAAAAIDAPPDGPTPGEVEAALFPAVANRDVDLLFMIDNSSGISDKQNRFRAAFGSFITSLTTFAGGLPNLHIGIVTSDLGSTAADGMQGPDLVSQSGGCYGSGTSADLQTSAAVAGNFIVDIDAGNGMRTVNYTGSIADAFIASSNVGTTGCAYEQSIESTRRVLAGNPTAAGFLRPGARLAVVYLTDEDDCSLAHATLFDPDTSMLGPIGSFRCTRFGVTCDDGGATTDQMATYGIKSRCHSNESGTYLTRIADDIAFFRGLATDPRNVMMAAIAGPSAPFQVGPSAGNPVLAPSCMYDTAIGTYVADPGVRLEQLVAAFRHRVFSSACDPDYTVADAKIAHHLASMTGVPCLVLPLTPLATCRAFDERADGTSTEIPACAGAAAMPCFTLDADAATCPDLQHLLANVHRSSPPPADTMISVRCAL